MEPNVPAAQKDIEHSLPDPRLNPMINPRLGKNLGRWANVYYTTPPEKREQAVLELVRELEGAQAPLREAETAAPKKGEEDPGGQETLINPAVAQPGATRPRFCGQCGSSLRKEDTSLRKEEDTSREPKQRASLLPLVPPLPHVEGLSTETGLTHKRHTPWRHILFVLLASVTIAAWSLWHIRVNRAPQIVSNIPVAMRVARQTGPIVEPGDHQTQRMTAAQLVRGSSPGLKPAAGKPIGCGADHLGSCSGNELYRKTITLAEHIDALFIGYDKRVTRLLRDATAQVRDTTLQKQNRVRQANQSAQLWEHLQLASYASHEGYDVLKYRAELRRRTIVPRSDRRMANAYQNPQSCLELHYVAEDLRKLAANLRRTTLGASAAPAKASRYR
jgi:hypothetical protein